MKRYIFLLWVLSVSIIACKNSTEKQDEQVNGSIVQNPATLSGDTTGKKLPITEYEVTTHDFGKVQEGEKVQFEFNFKNTGNAPLLISNVKASCGCTTPDWPKQLIKPGEANRIKVVYDSKGREGEFSKSIVVTANTVPNTTTLKISGVVFKE